MDALRGVQCFCSSPALLPTLAVLTRLADPCSPHNSQAPLTSELRPQLVPRLRKYFLHPHAEPRLCAISVAAMLGCVSQDQLSPLMGLPAGCVQASCRVGEQLPALSTRLC